LNLLEVFLLSFVFSYLSCIGYLSKFHFFTTSSSVQSFLLHSHASFPATFMLYKFFFFSFSFYSSTICKYFCDFVFFSDEWRFSLRSMNYFKKTTTVQVFLLLLNFFFFSRNFSSSLKTFLLFDRDIIFFYFILLIIKYFILWWYILGCPFPLI